jgi:hypothetical protein
METTFKDQVLELDLKAKWIYRIPRGLLILGVEDTVLRCCFLYFVL